MIKFSLLDLLFPLDVFHLTQQGRFAQYYTIPTRDGLQILLLDIRRI